MKFFNFYSNNFINLLKTSRLSRSRYFLFDDLSYIFINQLMKHGRKSNAMSRYIDSLLLIKELTLISPIYFVRKAVRNARSLFNVNVVYRGRFMIHKATFMNPQTQVRRSIKLLLQLANKLHSENKNISYSQSLALSILNAFFKKGSFFKKIKKLHKKIKNRKLQFTRPHLSGSLNLRFKRTKKTKGFYYLNKYGLYKRLVPVY